MKNLFFSILVFIGTCTTTQASDTPHARMIHRNSWSRFHSGIMHQPVSGPKGFRVMFHDLQQTSYAAPVINAPADQKLQLPLSGVQQVREGDQEIVDTFLADQLLISLPDFSKADEEMKEPG